MGMGAVAILPLFQHLHGIQLRGGHLLCLKHLLLYAFLINIGAVTVHFFSIAACFQ